MKRLLKAGVTSALAVMVKADNSILTDQTKEMLARWDSDDDQALRVHKYAITDWSFPMKSLTCHKNLLCMLLFSILAFPILIQCIFVTLIGVTLIYF